jgi:hypothetical protein
MAEGEPSLEGTSTDKAKRFLKHYALVVAGAAVLFALF